jgi:mRNA interferase MazF
MLEYIFAILEWCRVIIALRAEDKKVLFKEGEIWWCSIGMNVGAEIYGKGPKFTRPVLIYKQFDSNFFFGIPLTSQEKEGNWYAPIHFSGRDNWAILSQARALDVRRLTKRIGTLNTEKFQEIQETFIKFYGPVMSPENSHPAGEAGIGGKSQIYLSNEDHSSLAN